MKKIILTILIVVVVLGAVGGGIFGIVSLTDGKLDTKKISKSAFSVGGLDAGGKYMNTNGSVYTKEAFDCQGLEANLAFDSSVEYQIYFYDQNNDFVHTTGKRSNAFVKTEVPFFAKYARIVITPKDDDVVSKLEVSKYAKQLKLNVNREQGFKNYTEDLVKVGIAGKLLNGSGELIDSDVANSMVSEYINISSYTESMIFRIVHSDLSDFRLFCYSNSKEYLGNVKVLDLSNVIFTSSEGVNYYSLSLSKLKSTLENISFIRISCSVVPEIHCR